MATKKTSRHDLLLLAKEYLGAIERGATGAELAAFFTPDVVQVEFPNRLLPHGATRDLQGILDGALRGQQVVRDQRFQVVNGIVAGERVALEVTWSATLALTLGTLPAGGEMRARFAVFLEYREGRIARQHNYDCFEPW